ncbi:uncharacterized protein LOC116113114 [Pistacia vera]|uniref:uncharacterized protein LOC116113114 n=1 Tax=Pistacia vera TaxID=55513 RepID=UPI001263BEC3|nr:uncharacterized protein LOC116113114 [Pistacia vera]
MDTRSGTSSPTIPHAYIIPMPGSEPNMNQNVTSTGSESSSLSTQNGNQNDMSVGSAESSSISVNNPNQSGTSTGSTQSSTTGSTQSSTTSVQRTTQSDTSSRSQSSSPSTQIDALAQIEWPPSLYLLSEKNRNHKLCLDLHKTALEGNVDEGKRLLRENSGSKVLRAAITEGLETVLHVAAGAKQTRFVEEMMKYLVEQEDMSTLLSILKLQNHKRNTAFCFAVMVGSMEIVQTMLDKDLSLLTIRGGQNMTPLYLASVFGQREIASFLYNKIRDKGANALEEILTAEDKRAIFFVSIKTTLYDLAYKLLDDQKELALAYNSDATPLHLLARTPLHLLAQTPSALTNESDKRDLSTQALELVELLWEKLLDQTDVQVKEYFHEHSDLLFDAAHLGNFEFLARLIHLYPDLASTKS